MGYPFLNASAKKTVQSGQAVQKEVVLSKATQIVPLLCLWANVFGRFLGPSAHPPFPFSQVVHIFLVQLFFQCFPCRSNFFFLPRPIISRGGVTSRHPSTPPTPPPGPLEQRGLGAFEVFGLAPGSLFSAGVAGAQSVRGSPRLPDPRLATRPRSP